MLLFTYGTSTTQNQMPYSVTKNDSSYVAGKIPPAKYYRATTVCGDKCSTTEIISNIDCNACKVTRSSSTLLNKNYYTSSSSYLKARSKLYNQGTTPNDYNATTNQIRKDGCDLSYNCGVYKRNNQTFQSNGAVSSSANILRKKYQNIRTSSKYNDLRPLYHGESTMNVQFKSQDPVCHIKTGTKNRC